MKKYQVTIVCRDRATFSFVVYGTKKQALFFRDGMRAMCIHAKKDVYLEMIIAV